QPTCTIAVFGEGSSTGRDGRTIPIGAVSELSSSPRPFGSPAEPSPVGEPPVPTPGRPSPVSPPDGTDVSALTFTCSQLELTVSCESDTTVSSPSPQSIWSATPSRRETWSLPAPSLISLRPGPRPVTVAG